MYARSTTVRGDPQKLDSAIAYARDEVMPMVQELPGCIGLSMLCDRDTGRTITTSAWDSEESMHNSESPIHGMRQRFAEMMGGSPEVQEWEIAVLHRTRPAPEGAACRVLWGQGDPADADPAMDTFRSLILPRLEELDGFCSVSMLINRETGKAVTATVYESRDAMVRAGEALMPMRPEFDRQMRGEVTEVAEFDLVLAHLRVPETV
jgi:heme-degrading monooxygenase HmoA